MGNENNIPKLLLHELGWLDLLHPSKTVRLFQGTTNQRPVFVQNRAVCYRGLSEQSLQRLDVEIQRETLKGPFKFLSCHQPAPLRT